MQEISPNFGQRKTGWVKMKIPQGMEQMVFSFAYYRVKDFEGILYFLKELEKDDLFSIDEFNIKSQKLSGTFLMEYPKNHWNPFSKMAGAKQVIGGAEIKVGYLKIDTRTKHSLSNLRDILEKNMNGLIEFEREKFQDVMEMLKKK